MIDLRKKVVWKQNWETNGHVNNVPKETLVDVHGDYSIVSFLQRPSYGILSPHAALNHSVNLRLKINFQKKIN